MNNPVFTKKMKNSHTILFPEMLEYHSELIASAFISCGYKMKVMHQKSDINEALRYINHDYCYPAVLIVGQILSTLANKQNKDQPFAILEPQSGGSCRAGNYYHVIKTVLHHAGYTNIPVISLNAHGQEKHPGFQISLKLIQVAFAAIYYGDLLMNLYQQTIYRETSNGIAKEKQMKWTKYLCKELEMSRGYRKKDLISYTKKILQEFSQINDKSTTDKKNALIGEIYIKFSNLGNHNLEAYLSSNQHPYQMSGFFNYCLYILDSELENAKLQGLSQVYQTILRKLIRFSNHLQSNLYTCYDEFFEFTPDTCFPELKKKTNGILNHSCNSRDGWLILAEAVDFLEKGFTNVLILHPFGCMVSHVCERGIIKQLHIAYPHASIHTIEYDRDSTKTLLESRIMLALA